MSDPVIPPGTEGLRVTVPKPDIVDVLVATVIAMLETIGELTSRQPEANKLATDVRSTFGP
ncbi:hypothetical protein [Azospirillum palustre]